MGNALRSFGGVIAGLVVGVLVIAGVKGLGIEIYPPSSDFGPHREVFKAHLPPLPPRFPMDAFLFVLVPLSAGSFSGSWLAACIAAPRHFVPGASVGAILLLLCVSDILILQQPAWLWMAALVVIPLSTYFGTKTGNSRMRVSREN